MPHLHRSAILPFSADFMFRLVDDIESYPEFLPWCGDVRVDRVNDSSLEASILINKAGLSQWFTTRNTMIPGESIEMSLRDGPFSRLHGNWRFLSLADGCKIEFDLDFEIKRGLATAIIAPAFAQIADSLVEAFCTRARKFNET